MNIDKLTLGQLKELSPLISGCAGGEVAGSMLGKEVIVRTYSAGVWFGILSKKSGSEVILKDARRMWRWKAAASISLSAVAVHGIERSKSKIVEPVDSVWLEAIEIIECSVKSAASISGADYVIAE